LIKDNVILGAYFGSNQINDEKETYKKLTSGNYSDQNDESSEEDDLDKLSDFED
jgi:hypothetical protein